jgi:hypothetical protein
LTCSVEHALDAFSVVSENFDSAYFAGWANDFDLLTAVARRLNEFERLYNEIAEPFGWKFPAPTSTAGWSASSSARPAVSTSPHDRGGTSDSKH